MKRYLLILVLSASFIFGCALFYTPNISASENPVNKKKVTGSKTISNNPINDKKEISSGTPVKTSQPAAEGKKAATSSTKVSTGKKSAEDDAAKKASEKLGL